MAAIGSAALLAPSFGAASRTAIALSAVAVRPNPERRLASLAATNPRPENASSVEPLGRVVAKSRRIVLATGHRISGSFRFN
jgi:hypothetical protein